MPPTRRQFLASSAGAATVAVGATRPTRASHPTARPEHVSLAFDENRLKKYRPLLRIGHLVERPEAQYAWIATSPEHDTDVMVYVTYFLEQQGATGADSHVLDREPLYVLVNSETGAVERVLYSAYHWLKASTSNPPVHDETHPAFEVAKTYHHYLTDPQRRGSFVEIRELGTADSLADPADQTKFEQWLDTGWEADLREGSMVNPWSMLNPAVDSWWAPATEELLREVYLTVSQVPFIDLFGAGNTDL